MRGEVAGMESGGDRGEAVVQVEGGGVEELVGDAEDAAGLDGAEMMPVALLDEAGEGDAIAGAAPGKEEDVGVGGGDGFGGGAVARFADELSVGGGDEFGDPGLGVDEGFAPLFAVDGLGWAGCRLRACVFDCGLEDVDEGFGGGKGVDLAGDEADVEVDVGEGGGREGEDGDVRFEDGGEGFGAIGDAGDDEIGAGVQEGLLVGFAEGPGVVQDGDVAGGERGDGLDAVFGDGAEGVERAEMGEGEGDGGLEAGDAHGSARVAAGVAEEAEEWRGWYVRRLRPGRRASSGACGAGSC
jgi:hypothetical protein